MLCNLSQLIIFEGNSKNQHYKSGCEVYEGGAGAAKSIVKYLLMKKSSLLHISIPLWPNFNVKGYFKAFDMSSKSKQ
jgi:hypothetical protein